MVERDDHPPVATFFAPAIEDVGATAALTDSAAHHARVKRLETGDFVRLTNGAGTIAIAELVAMNKQGVNVHIRHVHAVPREPAIHLRVPIGDRDRMLWLAEKATELGITSWQGIRFHRSKSVSPRGEGAAFGDKVRARMISALEQSGGAWLPAQIADADLDAISYSSAAALILLDAQGEALVGTTAAHLALPAANVATAEPVVLFGPEGGVEPAERTALTDRGWRPVRLASSTLRFETAGIAAVSVLRALQVGRQVSPQL